MFKIEDIEERVDRIENDRKDYVRMALDWEKAWRLESFNDRTREEAILDGQEQVTLPDPFNTVQLGLRLMATDPKIEVPSRDATDEEDKRSLLIEKWLIAAWQRSRQQQGRNIIADSEWSLLVRGRCVFETKWVQDALPKKRRGKQFPILIRALDPIQCGFKTGPLYTEYAYHKYTESRVNVRQRYPEADIKERRAGRSRLTEWDDVEVTDFWWIDDVGDVWNAVLASDSDKTFLKAPKKTDYADIPMIEVCGESGDWNNEAYKGLGILFSSNDLWKYKNRLASQIGTGLLWHFWPFMYSTNESGVELPANMQVRPGVYQPLPPGTQIQTVTIEPNVPLAQTMMGMVDGAMQQSGFPGVMFGQAPGELQAGYGVSLLADAAKGRIKLYRENLENGIAAVNEMLLSLVEQFAGEEGVQVWGKDAASDEMYRVSLTPADVDGIYDNLVVLSPQVPQDEIQSKTMALREKQEGILSTQTYRDRYFIKALPPDEQARVDLERAMQTPEMQPKVALAAFKKYFGPAYKELIKGTPLEQLDNPPPPPPPQPPMGPPQGPPPGPPPDMMGGGMPPDMMGGGGPPPPMGPENFGGQLPSMNFDTGAIPPQMQGQIGPEQLGMAGMDPALFQELMNNPLPPGEADQMMMGM